MCNSSLRRWYPVQEEGPSAQQPLLLPLPALNHGLDLHDNVLPRHVHTHVPPGKVKKLPALLSIFPPNFKFRKKIRELLRVARISPSEWENPHPCKEDPEELESILSLSNSLWCGISCFMCQGSDILPKYEGFTPKKKFFFPPPFFLRLRFLHAFYLNPLHFLWGDES